ncbi:Alkali-sensitive linkage protein 1 [Metarhizium brunneum]|uniref:Alkali-sensitive linkage protein 1 n=1 Tax=Metarhizium brunneum TaxID=500148 RepID=A0A7D5Z4U9_9HYPO
MYTNKISALLGAIAAIEQASALSLHRHGHKLQKKQDVVDWVTVFTTVYVTEGAPAPEPTVQTNDGIVTSQHVVVTPTPKIDAPANFQALLSSSAPAPAPSPTSLVTQVKPAPSSVSQVKPAPSSGSGDGSGSSTGAPFSGKRGLAYNDPNLANLFGKECKSGACGWAYNWGDSPGSLDNSYSYIPMLWGNKMDFFDRWGTSCSKANGAKAVFSFNEPDNVGQADMSAADAATNHVKYMNPCDGKALVGAPAITNSNVPGEGRDWLKQFVSECETKGCKYDFCNVHWYSPAAQLDQFFEHIEEAHVICGKKPIFVTEFAPTGSDSEIDDFMTKAIPKLDSLDYVYGYSYFMIQPNSLLSSATSLSSVGKIFASA